jgi:hypothetical protein
MNFVSAGEEFSESLRVGRLAQLGERLVYTQEVGGSIPSPPIRNGLLNSLSRSKTRQRPLGGG